MYILVNGQDPFEKERYYLDFLKTNNIDRVNLVKKPVNKKTVGDIVNALLTPSIFGTKKLIVLDAFGFDDEAPILNKAISDSDHDVISFEPVLGLEPDTTVNFNVTTKNDLITYVMRAYNNQIRRDVATYLVEYVNENRQILENEVQKMQLFSKDNLTKTMINENCFYVYENNIYSLYDDLINDSKMYFNRVKHCDINQFWSFSYYTRKQILESCSGKVMNYTPYKQKAIHFFQFHYKKADLLRVYEILIDLECLKLESDLSINFFELFYIRLKQEGLLGRPVVK